jgi:electron transfer flavoprotein beta subunit
MHIIVPIKQVPETQNVKMDPETGTVIRDGVDSIVNPLDLYAVELAIRLAGEHKGRVTAISMGPPKAAEALREVIAMGVDDAVLISDRKFGGSDTWATSYILAAAIQKLDDFSLIICGERATDGDTGQVGPGLAAFLDLPVLTYVSNFDELSPDSCKVKRLLEEGYEQLSSTLPAVLTVVKEVSDPRLPTLRGKIKARQYDLPIWGSEYLPIDLEKVGLKGSPTRVVNIARPQVARTCTVFNANSGQSIINAADEFYRLLQQGDHL